MTKKKRIPIPAELVAEIMFSSDRTCCICNERGKSVQIHHIDENSSNNTPKNLAVLCLPCHDETQISGGFGRKLNAELVTKYRDDWLIRVNKRRADADAMANQRLVGETLSTDRIAGSNGLTGRKKEIMEYVSALPDIRQELMDKAQPEWDSGVTSSVVQASYQYVDSLQGILVALANLYKGNCIGGKEPNRFISEIISSRYNWHRSHAEPDGPGTGGTIINVLVSGNVITDVEKMVLDVVHSLVEFYDHIEFKDWDARWKE